MKKITRKTTNDKKGKKKCNRRKKNRRFNVKWHNVNLI